MVSFIGDIMTLWDIVCWYSNIHSDIYFGSVDTFIMSNLMNIRQSKTGWRNVGYSFFFVGVSDGGCVDWDRTYDTPYRLVVHFLCVGRS